MSPPSWSTSFPPSVASPRSTLRPSYLPFDDTLNSASLTLALVFHKFAFSSPHRFLGEKNSTCQSRAMPNCRQNLDFSCLGLICQYLYPELQQVNAVFINKGMVLPFKSGGINVCTWNPNIHAHGVSQQLLTNSTHDLPTHPPHDVYRQIAALGDGQFRLQRWGCRASGVDLRLVRACALNPWNRFELNLDVVCMSVTRGRAVS